MSHPTYKPPLHFVLRLRLQKGGECICGTLWYVYISWSVYTIFWIELSLFLCTKYTLAFIAALVSLHFHLIGFSNPPAVWNYVRDMEKDWEHLASFLGYSDLLISEIKSKSSWDVKSQIRDFMRVCLIPDCGEGRTREIMEKISGLIMPASKSKFLNLISR